MTDRHAGYVVALARDVREDDAQAIVTAIRMIKGVAGVEPVTADPTVQIARMDAHARWRDRLLELIRDGPGGG